MHYSLARMPDLRMCSMIRTVLEQPKFYLQALSVIFTNGDDILNPNPSQIYNVDESGVPTVLQIKRSFSLQVLSQITSITIHNVKFWKHIACSCLDSEGVHTCVQSCPLYAVLVQWSHQHVDRKLSEARLYLL